MTERALTLQELKAGLEIIGVWNLKGNATKNLNSCYKVLVVSLRIIPYHTTWDRSLWRALLLREANLYRDLDPSFLRQVSKNCLNSIVRAIPQSIHTSGPWASVIVCAKKVAANGRSAFEKPGPAKFYFSFEQKYLEACTQTIAQENAYTVAWKIIGDVERRLLVFSHDNCDIELIIGRC